MVASNITYNQIPFQTRTEFVKITDDTVRATLTIQVPNQGALNEFGRVSTMTDRVVDTFEDTIAVDSYVHDLFLRPGRYRLNLAVKDPQTGKVATIEKALVVPAQNSR